MQILPQTASGPSPQNDPPSGPAACGEPSKQGPGEQAGARYKNPGRLALSRPVACEQPSEQKGHRRKNTPLPLIIPYALDC
eukprot:scaffold14543_cov30-Tisochrysis_lutea.AAC.6